MVSSAQRSPQQVVQAWQALGLPDDELALYFGVDAATLQAWAEGRRAPTPIDAQLIGALDHLHRRLTRTFVSASSIAAWLHYENPYLAGVAPWEMLTVLRPDRVEAAIEAIDSGFAL